MEPPSVTIVVKASQHADIAIEANSGWSVRRLRDVIGLNLGKDPAFLRLVHAGAMLQPAEDSRLLGEALRTPAAARDAAQSSWRTTVHCVVSERRADLNAPSVPHDGPRTVGFARLREAGFTAEEIEELRQQFQLLHGVATPLQEERWLNDAVDPAPRQLQQRAGGENFTEIYDYVFLGALIGFLVRKKRHMKDFAFL